MKLHRILIMTSRRVQKIVQLYMFYVCRISNQTLKKLYGPIYGYIVPFLQSLFVQTIHFYDKIYNLSQACYL